MADARIDRSRAECPGYPSTCLQKIAINRSVRMGASREADPLFSWLAPTFWQRTLGSFGVTSPPPRRLQYCKGHLLRCCLVRTQLVLDRPARLRWGPSLLRL